MDRDEIRAGIEKGIHVAVRIIQHQVGVEKQAWVAFTQIGNSLWPETEIRDEMPVHDIEMEPLYRKGGDLLKSVGKTGVVRRKD